MENGHSSAFAKLCPKGQSANTDLVRRKNNTAKPSLPVLLRSACEQPPSGPREKMRGIPGFRLIIVAQPNAVGMTHHCRTVRAALPVSCRCGSPPCGERSTVRLRSPSARHGGSAYRRGPLMMSPFSLSEVLLGEIVAGACGDRQRPWRPRRPLLFFHGPLPMRSFAFTAGLPEALLRRQIGRAQIFWRTGAGGLRPASGNDCPRPRARRDCRHCRCRCWSGKKLVSADCARRRLHGGHGGEDEDGRSDLCNGTHWKSSRYFFCWRFDINPSWRPFIPVFAAGGLTAQNKSAAGINRGALCVCLALTLRSVGLLDRRQFPSWNRAAAQKVQTFRDLGRLFAGPRPDGRWCAPASCRSARSATRRWHNRCRRRARLPRGPPCNSLTSETLFDVVVGPCSPRDLLRSTTAFRVSKAAPALRRPSFDHAVWTSPSRRSKAS